MTEVFPLNRRVRNVPGMTAAPPAETATVAAPTFKGPAPKALEIRTRAFPPGTQVHDVADSMVRDPASDRHPGEKNVPPVIGLPCHAATQCNSELSGSFAKEGMMEKAASAITDVTAQ